MLEKEKIRRKEGKNRSNKAGSASSKGKGILKSGVGGVSRRGAGGGEGGGESKVASEEEGERSRARKKDRWL